MNKRLLCTLAGAGTIAAMFALSAYGAQSVHSLVAEGQALQAKMQSLQAQASGAQQKSKDLAAMAASIKAQQAQLNPAVQKHNQAIEQLKQNMADYQKNCQKNTLTPDQLKTCQAQQKTLNAQINQINTATTTLQTQQDALQKKISDYNSQSAALNTSAKDNGPAVKKTFADQEAWLDRARSLVVSEAFAPYRKAAGCPNVTNPPTNAAELQQMSTQIIGCLQNLERQVKGAPTAAGSAHSTASAAGSK